MQLIKNPYKLIDFYILVETINYTFTIYRLIPLNIFETYSLFLKNFYYKLCLPINKVHPSQNLLILDAITSTQSVDTTRLIHNSRNCILDITQLTLQIRSGPASPVHDERNRAK